MLLESKNYLKNGADVNRCRSLSAIFGKFLSDGSYRIESQ